jgi:hypothetical protein
VAHHEGVGYSIRNVGPRRQLQEWLLAPGPVNRSAGRRDLSGGLRRPTPADVGVCAMLATPAVGTPTQDLDWWRRGCSLIPVRVGSCCLEESAPGSEICCATNTARLPYSGMTFT